MDTYLTTIKTAMVIFPFLAILMTFPYLVYQYRKYGSIPILRSVIMYSLALYLLCMYLLVILPLPPISEVASYTGPTKQLIPFQFIADFIHGTCFQITEPSTWLKALTEKYVLQVVFNVLLFVPLGIYLNYYFQCGWKKVLLIAFSVSLFFELTQLSGLYGIYPRGYRLFDVDDLLLNTAGGLLGYMAARFVRKILPSRQQLDEKAYEKGQQVTLGRRAVAFCLDWMLLGTAAILLAPIMFPGLLFYLMPIVYFSLMLYGTKGYTPGKRLLHIRVVDKEGSAPALSQCVIRSSLFYFAFVPLLLVWACYYGITRIDGHKKPLFYEAISRTGCISTMGKPLCAGWKVKPLHTH
ncbi:VanZ family protein [Anaerovorax odorimutans]|uniref:VanZ family protein n=1 Tax=Anaerovorax odorimutans TaxID=109327 RepID=A0ABT1RNC3_9FIRM|nr:VanZ family protein [Anaerovorax odorimutans]MCQ4636691.1 VanZ family protein [Anaerovorax odorimutans]